MEKEKQRHLLASNNSLGGFAERLIRLGAPLSSGTPRGWVCPSPSAARPSPGGRSRGTTAKTCMRTCAKIDARAHELMIGRRIDAACPARAVLLTSTSSGSAGRAGDILLQPSSIAGCSCSPRVYFAFAPGAKLKREIRAWSRRGPGVCVMPGGGCSSLRKGGCHEGLLPEVPESEKYARG